MPRPLSPIKVSGINTQNLPRCTCPPSGSASTVIPLRIGGDGLVVEGSVSNGARQEMLRTLCQVANTTEFWLEARLVKVEDADWHMVASRSGGCGTVAGGALPVHLSLPQMLR